MEMEEKYASRGVGGTALGLSIGALGAELLGGTFNNILGNGCRGEGGSNALINRDMEIAYLKSRDAAKTDTLELYRYVDNKFNAVEAQISAQAVVNAQVAANLACMQNSIATLNGLTKTVIPITNVCPLPATATTTTTG